jgi:hypothetical protein
MEGGALLVNASVEIRNRTTSCKCPMHAADLILAEMMLNST